MNSVHHFSFLFLVPGFGRPWVLWAPGKPVYATENCLFLFKLAPVWPKLTLAFLSPGYPLRLGTNVPYPGNTSLTLSDRGTISCPVSLYCHIPSVLQSPYTALVTLSMTTSPLIVPVPLPSLPLGTYLFSHLNWALPEQWQCPIQTPYA